MHRFRLALALTALPAAPAIAAQCTMGQVAELPVTMEGLRPIVPAKINGTEVRFLTDSGAPFSLISPSVAAELRLALQPTPFNFQLRGIGGATSTSTTKVKNFEIAGASVPDVTFLVGGSDSGRAGYLGENVLGLFDTEYDLANGVIRLMRPHDCGNANLAYWAVGKPVVTIDMDKPEERNPHIYTHVTVNGVRLRAALDSGAARTTLTLKAAARAGVKPGDPGVRPAGMAGGIGHKMSQSWSGPFASFAIGDEQIRDTRIVITDIPDAAFDMLLGADFFLSHHIFVAKSMDRIFLTYNGGPVFNLTGVREPQAADATAPTDADGLARRGAAFAARRDFAHAFPDLTRAIELAPGDPRYLLARADAHLANRQPLLAKTDLDAALKLEPGDPDALMLRAQLYLITDHRPDALADLDAADRAAPQEADLRRSLGDLFGDAGAYDRAVHQYDLWLQIHRRDDNQQPRALNGRCWARAMLGRELDKALSDCDAALRAEPKAAGYFDSRGLVRLRMGDWDKAIFDYDSALVLQPRIAWALYGRGLAKLHKGLKAEGEADLAAALALDPKIASEAERIGLIRP